jgi:vancomycin resistance protein YoaR
MSSLTAPSSESFETVFARWLGGIFSMLVIVASCLGMFVGGFQIVYANSIYPGVSVHGINLSGLSREAAVDKLSREFTYATKTNFLLRDGDKTWNATPAQLGATFDVKTTADAAFAYGRSGKLDLDLIDQFWAWYEGNDIAPIITFDSNRGAAFLKTIATQIDRAAVEASLTVSGTDVKVTQGIFGRTVNPEKTLTKIIPSLRALTTTEVTLVIDEYRPAVMDATQQAALAKQILSQPLSLIIEKPNKGDPGPWVFDQRQLAAMLTINRVEDAQGARYVVGLDSKQLLPFLQTLAPKLETKTKDARYIFNDERKELVPLAGQEAVDGRELDSAATIKLINEKLLAGQHSVPLVFKITKPKLHNNVKAAELGITGLVSSQVTSFKGSSAERLNNIRTGAGQFHGVMIPPGGTFSFNEFLGDISLDKGFSEALIIYAGKTIKGVGGGICQVSTTAFRAAFFGGYPIVERHSHAYRVIYYERQTPSWTGPGLDAAIFSPDADFKFRNDREAWLLIETYILPSAGTVQFKFYSADDGRKVKVSPAEIRNEIPAPKDLYELDPKLKKDEIRQIDYSADGADTSVTRKVEKDGKTLFENTIKTHYLPWQAVFQYGPDSKLPEGVIVAPTPTPKP